MEFRRSQYVQYLLLEIGKSKLTGRLRVDPQKVYRSGPNEEVKGDPLVPLEKVLDEYKFIKPHGAPPFTGT